MHSHCKPVTIIYLFNKRRLGIPLSNVHEVLPIKTVNQFFIYLSSLPSMNWERVGEYIASK